MEHERASIPSPYGVLIRVRLVHAKKAPRARQHRYNVAKVQSDGDFRADHQSMNMPMQHNNLAVDMSSVSIKGGAIRP